MNKLTPKVLLEFFDTTFIDHPSRVTIHNYSSNYKGKLEDISEKYSLNKKVDVKFTKKYDVLDSQEFIYAYKTLKNARKLLKSKSKRKSRRYYLKKN